MTRDELLAELARIVAKEARPHKERDLDDTSDLYYDPESAHYDADAALLAFIDDAEIAAAYEAVPKWYS